jgi:hypothetical protein
MPPNSPTVIIPQTTGTGSIEPQLTGNLVPDILEIFRWLVMASTILAVIFLAIAGFQYATTDAFGKKMDLKGRIREILLGLTLALASVLILQTINPRLVLVDFSMLGATGVRIGGGGADQNLNDVDNVLIEVNGEREIYGGVVGGTGNSVTVSSGVRIDTDGKNPPPFNDPHYQDETSYPGLDANKDNYVVVPIGSKIPLGSQVYVHNHTTGAGVWAIVGDRGPTANGYGEMSLNAARTIGSWREGMGNSALPHTITYTFYNK